MGPLLEGPSLPLSDWELWACASQVIKTRGQDAPHFVAEQIGVLVLARDDDGIRTWQEIAKRITQLTADERRSGTRH